MYPMEVEMKFETRIFDLKPKVVNDSMSSKIKVENSPY